MNFHDHTDGPWHTLECAALEALDILTQEGGFSQDKSRASYSWIYDAGMALLDALDKINDLRENRDGQPPSNPTA